ncbi:ATP-binding protein [Amycolatopsis sp. CA-128772]|uniref:ATP-binding protein n=1 Tax=Amycolatopsis sp. CA-128772 TaxID=2073159 RepID=UPI000CD1F80C|nr:ATP-binding protein [Amycolatopsis sp. CA-128772]
MDWHFVGRAEHLERIRSRLAEREPDPLVVVGEPGIGRTSVVRKALAGLDPGRDALLEVRPGGHEPFSSLRHLLPAGAAPPAGRDAVREVADAVRALAAGRRPVLLADDAHLADHATMLVLQHLNRHAGAFLLLTHPVPAPRPGGGDPVDCLRYERGIKTVRLPPLSLDEVGAVLAKLMDGPVRSATTEALHAATAGNPGLLHDIVVRQELRTRMIHEGGRWRLTDAPPAEGPALTCRGVAHLLAAVARAWESLALDQVEDLCRLAAWSGAGAEVALVKAAVHLLRGRAAEAFEALDQPARGGGASHHARPTGGRLAGGRPGSDHRGEAGSGAALGHAEPGGGRPETDHRGSAGIGGEARPETDYPGGATPGHQQDSASAPLGHVDPGGARPETDHRRGAGTGGGARPETDYRSGKETGATPDHTEPPSTGSDRALERADLGGTGRRPALDHAEPGGARPGRSPATSAPGEPPQNPATGPRPGHAAAGNSLRHHPDDPHPVLLRAMCLAFGRQDPGEADALLAAAAAASPHRERLRAYRGWLLAVAGRRSEAADVLSGLTHHRDRHAALFAHAAEAIGHLDLGRGAAAISHLRRALVLAEADRAVLPWMAPYLRAYLIDALLLAGRITEATSLAGEFHAAAPDCGWKVAVAMAALTGAARTAAADVSSSTKR